MHVKREADPQFQAGSEIGECVFGSMKQQSPVSDDQCVWFGGMCVCVGDKERKKRQKAISKDSHEVTHFLWMKLSSSPTQGLTFHTSRNRQPDLVFTTAPLMSHISPHFFVTCTGTGIGPITPRLATSGSNQSFPGSIFVIVK